MANNSDTFPNAVEAVVLVGALFLAEYVVARLLYDMQGVLEMDYRDLGALIMVLGNGCVFTILMHYKGLGYRELFHASPSSMAATALLLVPAILLTIPILLLVTEAVGSLLVSLFPLSNWESEAFADMVSGSFSSIVATCILAPVLEEMLFRGIILRSFLRQYSRWAAIVGSAALFGFAHMNLYQYVTAVIVGVFLGWLYERSRSLLPCIALHAAYNTGCTLAALGADSGADSSASDLSSWTAALLLGGAGIFMLRRVLLAPRRRAA